jgi:Fe-S oxidoreductase
MYLTDHGMKSPADQKGEELVDLYDSVEQSCVECGLCQKDCRFLQKYGSPKEIAGRRSQDPAALRTSFECSQCRLCMAVCPKKIDPAAMLGAMRRQAQVTGKGTFDQHITILRYERWGLSSAISWYGLPAGCNTVLFPGCAMAGSRSERVIDLYTHLRREIPSLGIVLDCCTKPSHDLGRTEYFSLMFGALRDALVAREVKQVLVACPSCYRVWKDYGGPIAVTSIYELLAETGPLHQISAPVEVTVHDPCPTRYDLTIHQAVRKMVTAMGFSLREMKHHGKKTICCGEGGAACYIAPDLAGNWTATRAKEAEGTPLVTYCAGCTHFLGRLSPAVHVTDLFFEPGPTLTGKVHITRSPMTWLKRVLLKGKLRRLVAAKVSGSRSADGRVLLR